MKRYIASDFHVRNEITDYNRVLSFLELVEADADELLIVGDWLELLWSNLEILTQESPYRDVIEKTREIAQRKIVRVIPGNHDWNIELFSSYLQPIQIIAPFSEDGIYYCHGHQWDWVSLIMGTPVDPVYWSVAFPFVFPPALGIWIISQWFAEEKDRYFWGIAIIHERAAEFARRNGYHSVVFGHTHYPSVELRGGINLYNCGDFVDSYSYLVEENGIIELRRLT